VTARDPHTGRFVSAVETYRPEPEPPRSAPLTPQEVTWLLAPCFEPGPVRRLYRRLAAAPVHLQYALLAAALFWLWWAL
jgi:hypothetical protein